jgi:Xaa-Pro dipeptidase
MTPEEAKRLYDVDDVQYTTSIAAHLYKMATSSKTHRSLMTIERLTTPIALGVAQPATPALKTAIETCRIVKDAYEIELVREANRISSLAHVALMRATRSAKSERQLKAIFVGECIAEGADGDGQSDGQAYGAIIAAGTAGEKRCPSWYVMIGH